MKTNIEYVKKEKLFPAFGLAKNNMAYVREDLPKSVQAFILQHELYHLEDKAKNWIWREIKANLYGAFMPFIGFIYCCVLSLSRDRLRHYYERFKKGK